MIIMSKIHVNEDINNVLARNEERPCVYSSGTATSAPRRTINITGTDINNCSPNPCVNGACTDGINSYTCTCNAGWTGTNCDVNIDDCTPNPCVNGACTDGTNAYTCGCFTGWSGTTCNIRIDPCSPNPCLHGGVCTAAGSSYTCTCTNRYTGTTCADPLEKVRITAEGYVQVWSSTDTWDDVCGSNWDSNDAKVVCRYLRYSDGEARFGQVVNFIAAMTNVGCIGTESDLFACPNAQLARVPCATDKATVKCTQYGSCPNDPQVANQIVNLPSDCSVANGVHIGRIYIDTTTIHPSVRKCTCSIMAAFGVKYAIPYFTDPSTGCGSQATIKTSTTNPSAGCGTLAQQTSSAFVEQITVTLTNDGTAWPSYCIDIQAGYMFMSCQ